jgi:serpin B
LKKAIFIILSAVLLLGAVSCSQPVYGQELRSDKQRDDNPAVSAAELAALVEGNSEFALDLYQQLKEEDGNIFFSPYSLSLALAMTYAGAEGETEQQMKDTLHFLLEDEALHAAFNKLALELAARGEDSEDFSLDIVNAIWGQQDYDFLPAYLDLLAENYGAGMRLVDFITETEAARQAINNWGSEQTRGKIEDLLQEGVLSAATRLVLTNAMYFNAAWHYPFDEDNTEDGVFYLLDGTTANVSMMHQTEGFNYTEGDGYQAVELMYR